MKTCTKCGETKPETEFGKQATGRDGLRAWCKSCGIAWRAANQDKVSVIRARYNAANPEKVKAWNDKRKTDNPEKRRIHNRNRRALKVGGKLSGGIVAKLFTLQRGKCACGCKQPLGDKFHLDHIMPLKLGGTNTDDNIQLLRSTCNLQKHAKHPVDFMQQRGYLL